jgi:hypothetical protein
MRERLMVRVKTALIVAAVSLVAVAGIASATETITYTYDAKGRLILVTHSGTVNNNVVANYTFGSRRQPTKRQSDRRAVSGGDLL